MKTLDSDMQTHLESGLTTLCTCWKIVRKDDEEFFFTDLDVDLLFDGNTYVTKESGTASSVEHKSNASVSNMEVMTILDANEITDADLRNGLWDHAKVWIFAVNYEDVTMGKIKQLHGRLGEVQIRDSMAEVEFLSLTHRLQQQVGRMYGYECDANFADSLTDNRCKLVAATYTETGTLTSAVDKANFTDSNRPEATNYFRYGVITWTSGLNDGLSMEIKEFTSGGVFELLLPMPYNVEVGDTYSAIAGCDKDWNTCKDTYDNLINFRGFPHIPGRDALLETA